MYSSFIDFRNAWQHTYRSVVSQLNSGDTCTDFKFSGKIELSIDLFTRMFIGFDIDGCANFKIFGDIESYPVAFFIFNLLICLFTCSSVSLKLNSISSVLFSSIFIILGWLLSIFIFSSPMSLATFIKKLLKISDTSFGSFAIFRLTLISAYGQGRMGEPKTIWISLVSTYGQGRIGEPKPVQLSQISAYGEGRMVEPKPVWLTLISAHEHGRMGEPKPVWISLNFSIWTRKNGRAQNCMIILDFCTWIRKNGSVQTRMINPDFCIWTGKNGWAENCMNIPDFYIWTRKNRWAQTRTIIPDFWIWTRKNGRAQTVWLSLISAYG